MNRLISIFSARGISSRANCARAPLLHDTETLQASPDTLVVLNPGASGDVKLWFFGGLDLARVMPPAGNPDNGLRVASLLDLAGTKVKAVQDRAELKDYLDLAALLRHGLGLFDAPPGVFDARSWRYWHLMFARPVPPLPVRIVTAGH